MKIDSKLILKKKIINSFNLIGLFIAEFQNIYMFWTKNIYKDYIFRWELDSSLRIVPIEQIISKPTNMVTFNELIQVIFKDHFVFHASSFSMLAFFGIGEKDEIIFFCMKNNLVLFKVTFPPPWSSNVVFKRLTKRANHDYFFSLLEN